MGVLKELADKHQIAIVLIHHLRKQSDDDPMNMISGTTGISGAADSSFVLRKERGSKTVTLYCTGRDIEYRELSLEFDSATHIWNLLSDSVTSEPKPSDIAISSLSAFLNERNVFLGTATELAEAMKPYCAEALRPNVLMKKLL